MLRNSLAVLVAVICLGCAPIPSSKGESARTQATIVRTTFLASELRPMLALYQDILGYEIVYSDEYQGTTFRRIFEIDKDADVEFAILKPPAEGGGSIGILVVADDLEPSIPSAAYAPKFGQAILFSTTEDLDAVYDRVRASDTSIVTVVAPPFDTAGGREMVIADANGVRIYVFEPEAVSRSD